MNQEKLGILTQTLQHTRQRLQQVRHPWALGGVAALSLFSMVAAFGTAPSEDRISRPLRSEALALHGEAVDTTGQAYVREELVQSGDTLGSLLQRLGIHDSEADQFLRTDKAAQGVARQLRPGKLVSARTDVDGKLQHLYFPLNSEDRALIIERKGDNFTAQEKNLATTVSTVLKQGEIRSSLFAATDAADIPDAIATQLADIFGSDIDFLRDLRRGDQFSITYEMHYSRGHAVKSGRILAAEFINQGKTYTAIYYRPANAAASESGGYYTTAGKPLRKAFLRSPLEFSRITSGFTSARFHPILQQWRAHKGVDYGAPTGTRVRSTGDGTIAFLGKQNGYGNLIVVQHNGRYSTAYGHLNGFAAGLRVGSKVQQGSVIGYVGQTGYATGPHLHYEFRVNGDQVNPLAIALPDTPPLEAHQLAGFKTAAAPYMEQFKLFGASSNVAFK